MMFYHSVVCYCGTLWVDAYNYSKSGFENLYCLTSLLAIIDGKDALVHLLESVENCENAFLLSF